MAEQEPVVLEQEQLRPFSPETLDELALKLRAIEQTDNAKLLERAADNMRQGLLDDQTEIHAIVANAYDTLGMGPPPRKKRMKFKSPDQLRAAVPTGRATDLGHQNQEKRVLRTMRTALKNLFR